MSLFDSLKGAAYNSATGFVGGGTVMGKNAAEASGIADETRAKEQAEEANSLIAEAYGLSPVYTGPDENAKNSEANKAALALQETKKNKKFALSASIALDEKTGAIVVTAPEGFLKDKDFQQYFPAATLKELSQAYQLNKDYKVPYRERKEDGTYEEKEITIPEYISKLNGEFQTYIKNAYYAQYERNNLVGRYGDKAKRLTDMQMSRIMDTKSNVVTIPEVVRHSKFFDAIQNDIDADGRISAEDFRKSYNLNNMSVEDITELLANLEGFVGGSWAEDGEETYVDEKTGEVVRRKNTIDEVTKALALIKWIKANTANGEWYQELAVNAKTFGENFGYRFQEFFFDTTFVDAAAEFLDWGAERTFGHGTGWHEWKEKNEKAVEFFNESQALASEGTQMLANIGQITGAVGGLIAGGKALGGAIKGVKKLSGLFKTFSAGKKFEKAVEAQKAGERILKGSKIVRGIEAGKAATAFTVKELKDAVKGAGFVVKMMDTAQKSKMMTEIAKSFPVIRSAVSASGSFITGFFLDTVHDAFMFDTRNMLEALTACDDETRQYWLNQLASNAGFYIPIEGGKNVLKHFSTARNPRTEVGKLINAYTTRNVNRLIAHASEQKKEFFDWIYEAAGGRKAYLEDKLQDAIGRGRKKDFKKAERIQKKLDILNQTEDITRERRALGNIELEKDSLLKINDESYKDFMEASLSVKRAELAVDIYNRQIDSKRNEMVGMVKDPATGKLAFINESLATSSAKTAKLYIDLGNAAKDAGLGPNAKDSLLPQVVIDYMMGTANYRRMSAIANGVGDKIEEARKAADTIKTDLDKLEELLPDDVKKKALAYVDASPVFYSELNKYGIAHNYLSKDDIEGYLNKTWIEAGGYQPIVTLEGEKNFFIMSNDSRYRATLTQDMESITYAAKADQHYMDPEIVRQTRLNVAAKSAINRELLDNYVGRVGASMEEIVTGEQTRFVRDIERGRKDIKNAVQKYTSGTFIDPNSYGEFTFDKKNATKAPKKTKALNDVQMETVVGSMSDRDINQALIDRNRLVKGAAPDSWTREIEDEESFQAFYESLNASGKSYVDEKCAEFAKGDGDVSTYNNFLQVKSAYGNDFESGVRRAELAGDPSFANSNTAKKAYKDLQEGYVAFQNGYAAQYARSHLAGIPGINAEEFSSNIVDGSRSSIEDYLENIKNDKGFQKAVAAYYGKGANKQVPSALIDYFALQELKKKANLKAFKENLNKPLADFIEKNKKKLFQGDYSHNADDELKKCADKIFDDILDDEMNARRMTIESLGKTPIDREEINKEVKALTDEIQGIERRIDSGGIDIDYIAYMDSQGRLAYAKVDSSFASLYNRRSAIPHVERSAVAKANAIASIAFRKGTTAWNVASWGNQLFRDYASAIIMGGAWDSIKANADELKEVFGGKVVEQLKNFDPEGYEMKQVELALKRLDPEGKLGMDLNAAAVSRELMIGAAKSPSSTESGLYRKLWDEMRAGENADLDNLEETLRDKIKKLDPDNLINAKREEYLRNRVYANNLNDALKQGYTLKQARDFAEFAMNNATINFGRQVYHLQSIAESTPYFRAAINGHKSFWRMWSIDPIGVSGRIMGGLILPSIALITHSLATEENREVYESIPEWQKRESFVFVLNGEAMSIPFPQEMAAVVAPWRQFIEHLHGVDKATFAELAWNDVLGFSPIDLTGFSAVDFNRMEGDPTLADILGRGFSRMFAQAAPVPLKTAFILATEIDPYTGRNMSDARLWYHDDGTNSAQLMDATQSSFAKTLAKTGLLGKNPYVWSKVLSGAFGSTGVDALDTLNALFIADNAGALPALGTAINALGSGMSKPFSAQTVTADDRWYEAVRNLTREKNQITSTDEWKSISNNLMTETDPEKRKKLIAQQQDMINEYSDKVMNTTKRLVSEYQGTFDRHKFATVVQLLNFASEPGYQAGSQFSSNSEKNRYLEGKDLAIQMMSQMDLPETTDLSVFGYETLDSNGNPVMKYTEPLAILDAGNTLNNQADYHLANIQAIVNTNDLYDKHQEVTNQINAIYNRGKLTSKDYSEIDALQLHWNSELAKTLAPYVQQYGAEGVLGNKKVRDYLYTYVEVPNYWEVNNKGRSPSLGSRGNRKAAYYDSWIKTVFRVNDPYKGQYGKDLK